MESNHYEVVDCSVDTSNGQLSFIQKLVIVALATLAAALIQNYL